MLIRTLQLQNRRSKFQAMLHAGGRTGQCVLLALAMIFMLSRCTGAAEGPATSGAGGQVQTQSRVQKTADRLTVVDNEGRAVPGAKIMVGSGLGLPFASNVTVTDAAGLAVWPSAWTTAQPVTIEAPGHIRATYFAQMPGSAIFKIRRAHALKPLQLQGVTTGFGQLVRNGTLDVSLVFPAVPRSQVSSMELTQLIGTGVDKISVYGETISLPSNLSIPLQSESVFVVVPVTLDKPSYRTSVPAAGPYRFAAVHAQFDFKQTIADFQAGKSFFDVINRIDFRSYTTRDYDIRLPLQSANLPLGETELTPSVSVQASGLPSGYAMLATALADKNGLCVVTDVKRLLEGESLTLKAAPALKAETVLVRTLKKYDATRTDFSGADYEEASAIATPATQPASPGFLPFLKSVRTQARKLLFAPPTLPTGVTAGLTVVTLSKLDISSDGGMKLVEKNPIWDLYAPSFATDMELPATGTEVWTASGQYRWELRYGAYETSRALAIEALSPDAIGQMSHVVKTAADFIVP